MDDIPRNARIVCDGAVNCPLRHADSELEACLRCPWLRTVGAGERSRYVVCRPPFASLPPVDLAPSRS